MASVDAGRSLSQQDWDDWPWFGAFVGGVGFCAVIAVLYERSKKRSDILDLKPTRVLLGIAYVQLLFYVHLAATTYTANLVFGQANTFFFWQMIDSNLASFSTPLGLASGVALAAAYLLLIPSMVAVVRKSRAMLDHYLTLFIVHFVFVSVGTMNFPTSLAWWVFAGAGPAASNFVAEYVAYRFEIMAYKVNDGSAASHSTSVAARVTSSSAGKATSALKVKPAPMDPQESDASLAPTIKAVPVIEQSPAPEAVPVSEQDVELDLDTADQPVSPYTLASDQA